MNKIECNLEYDLRDRKNLSFTFLESNFSLSFEANGISLSEEYSNFPVSQQNFFIDHIPNKLFVRPIFVANSLLVRFKEAIFVEAKSKAEFWLNLPIIPGLFVDNYKLPSTREKNYKKAWFGKYDAGQMVQYYETSPLGKPEHKIGFSCSAILLENRSNEKLEVKKIHLETQYLSIFHHNQIILSNKIKLVFKGGISNSKFIIGPTPGQDYKDALLISSAISQYRPDSSSRIFGRFMEFTGLKFLVE